MEDRLQTQPTFSTGLAQTASPELSALAKQATRSLKIALVHDYLVQDGGAERVLACLQDLFPSAPTFVLFHDASLARPPFQGREIRASFLNKLPFAPRLYQWYLPLMPMAIEQLDLSGYDLIISSSIYFSKGIIVPPESTHICYCHTTTRFLWQDRLGYVNDLPRPRIIRALLPALLHRLRTWDRLAADRPDVLLTNSQTSQKRISRYYGRDSSIIYPPVDLERITPPSTNTTGFYWLAGGRLVGYKRFDLIVRAFAELDRPLKIFGIGPEEKKLRKLAGPKTEFLGHVDDATKIQLYQGAIGFLHPQHEDFGITAVEAMAAGKPVLTYCKGGGSETVLPGVTGEYLLSQDVPTIVEAVRSFKPAAYNAQTIRTHAEQFSEKRFASELWTAIGHALHLS